MICHAPPNIEKVAERCGLIRPPFGELCKPDPVPPPPKANKRMGKAWRKRESSKGLEQEAAA